MVNMVVHIDDDVRLSFQIDDVPHPLGPEHSKINSHVKVSRDPREPSGPPVPPAKKTHLRHRPDIGHRHFLAETFENPPSASSDPTVSPSGRSWPVMKNEFFS
jgi:hypothetical protein